MSDVAYLALPERGRGHATHPPTRLGRPALPLQPKSPTPLPVATQVRRVGTCLIALVGIAIVQEGVRNLLLEGGGWAYWCGMIPLWLALYVIAFLSTHFQMAAFQAPVAEHKYAKERVKPSRVVALSDSSGDIQPMNAYPTNA